MQQKILISLTSAVFASSLTAGTAYGSPIFSGQLQGKSVIQDLVIQNRLTPKNNFLTSPASVAAATRKSKVSEVAPAIVPTNNNSVNRPLFSNLSGDISTASNSQESVVAIAPANTLLTNSPTTNLEAINPLLDLATEVAMNSSIDLPMTLPRDFPTEVVANPYLEPETIFADPARLTPFQRGVASWYGPGFDGAYTASGEVFDQYAMTAAHPSLPFGTRVLVTNLDSGRSVLVRITDRGPFTGDRVIDLSQGAAESIGMIPTGVADVQISVIEP